jgi:hypothetical protein
MTATMAYNNPSYNAISVLMVLLNFFFAVSAVDNIWEVYAEFVWLLLEQKLPRDNFLLQVPVYI